MSGLGRAILAPLCLLAAVAADAPPDAPAGGWQERIRSKMAKPVSLELADTPADEALRLFQDILGETIVVEPGAAAAAKKPVHLSVKDVPAGKALAEMLSQAGLALSLKDEALVVAAMPGANEPPAPPPPAAKAPAPAAPPAPPPAAANPAAPPAEPAPAPPKRGGIAILPPRPEAAPGAPAPPDPSTLVTRVYDVRATPPRVRDFPGPDIPIPSLGPAPDPGTPPLVAPPDDGDPAESLAKFVRENVRPGAWGPGTSIGARDGHLVVTQTPAMHMAVAVILARLGALAGPPRDLAPPPESRSAPTPPADAPPPAAKPPEAAPPPPPGAPQR